MSAFKGDKQSSVVVAVGIEMMSITQTLFSTDVWEAVFAEVFHEYAHVVISVTQSFLLTPLRCRL